MVITNGYEDITKGYNEREVIGGITKSYKREREGEREGKRGKERGETIGLD